MKKFIRSFDYAFKGIGYATKTQLNFRVELVTAALSVCLGFALHIDINEWQWVLLNIVLVLITELFNTAIEFLTDLVSPGYNELAGRVKDVSAGAVLIACVFALTSGTIIFLPKLIALI
ncbi:MAG: diacylglycerol kinase family protein [Sphingobacteriaceae bacterium]|nr:MAG: diacylglycerol kinase family protein [Sphingobacteriaceae bacterium]